MKLYIYEHCPFCARVLYVAGSLNLSINSTVIDYDDETTTTKISGIKQVPVFVNDNNQALTESLDIIEHLLQQADVCEKSKPSHDVLQWQSDAFLTLQKIGYPRWYLYPLKEFKKESAQIAWREKKETETLNFDALLADTKDIARDAEELIKRAGALLNTNKKTKRDLVDKSIIFSILRGFTSAIEINWDPFVANWIIKQSKETGVSLLTGRFPPELNSVAK
ncbi:glutaredoxin 2 [Vibrio artabrorum]|uniref:glutaredoxin 2 n=1 Tax=Vibrio artabrorum TaxID=446374 RepID=UPI00354FC769